MVTIQKYVRAGSLEEAWQLNQNKRSRILGGMLWLRLGKGSVNTAIDLCDLGLLTWQVWHLASAAVVTLEQQAVLFTHLWKKQKHSFWLQ